MVRPSPLNAVSADKHQTRLELLTLGIEVLPGDAVDDSEDLLAAMFSGSTPSSAASAFITGGNKRTNKGADLFFHWNLEIRQAAIGPGCVKTPVIV
jgi:hypothetical protein